MSASLPDYCQKCSWLFSKMGACQPTGVSIIFSYVSFIPYLIIFLFIGLSLIMRGNRQIKMAVLLISAYIIGDRILKNIFAMPRPDGACKISYGFPSSHMVVICCYIFELFAYSNKSQKFFFIFLVVSQGMARVHLKYHTWDQVFGGFIFALIYTILFNV
jgi:membrane-associated phospholipid phosphatase